MFLINDLFPVPEDKIGHLLTMVDLHSFAENLKVVFTITFYVVVLNVLIYMMNKRWSLVGETLLQKKAETFDIMMQKHRLRDVDLFHIDFLYSVAEMMMVCWIWLPLTSLVISPTNPWTVWIWSIILTAVHRYDQLKQSYEIAKWKGVIQYVPLVLSLLYLYHSLIYAYIITSNLCTVLSVCLLRSCSKLLLIDYYIEKARHTEQNLKSMHLRSQVIHTILEETSTDKKVN